MKPFALSGILVYVLLAALVLAFVGGVFVAREEPERRSQAMIKSQVVALPAPEVDLVVEPLPWAQPVQKPVVVTPVPSPDPVPEIDVPGKTERETEIEPLIVPIEEEPPEQIVIEPEPVVIYRPKPELVVIKPRVVRRDPPRDKVRRLEAPPQTRFERELEEDRAWRRATLARWAREEEERSRRRRGN
jgi:hypothetical protein